MNGKAETVVFPDFAVVPRSASTPLPPTIQAGDGLGLQAGVVPTGWRTGGPDCLTVPQWQVQAYNEDFYILRESGCMDAEKPFLYLIFGENKALLEDTGVARRAGGTSTAIPTAPVIMDLMAQWAARKKHAPVPLMVIHSHAHSDHTAADAQFQALPNVQFIASTPEALQQAARNQELAVGRRPHRSRRPDNRRDSFPGHNEASIALYDRLTGNLLTGDSLYPGLLSVDQKDLATFTESMPRLTTFVRAHPVAHVFGTHIEQKKSAVSRLWSRQHLPAR